VLFGAASFDEFTTNWDLLNELSADDANSIAQTKDLEAQAAAAHEEYQQQEQVAAQKVAEAEQAKADAEQPIEAQRALAASLDAEVSQLVAQEQQAAAEAAAQAAAQAQAAAAAEAAGTTADGTTADGTTTDSGSADSGSSSASSGGSYDGGSDAVSRAYACLGAPYVWGAAGPGSYDCSGLVSYCITGTHSHVFTSSELNTYPAVSDPSPGDVCVRDGHCGIYIGGGQYINAATEGVGVIISSVPGDMKIVRP